MKLKLGDYIINFDEVLWIKRVGAGARVKFKADIKLDSKMHREDLLEIAYVSDEEWERISVI
jgi:hypothetical protein